jgi:hypothetical protein
MHRSSPSKEEGAGNAGCRPHPWPLQQKKQAAVTTGSAGTTGIPRAMVLTAAPRSPRCTGLFSHRRRARSSLADGGEQHVEFKCVTVSGAANLHANTTARAARGSPSRLLRVAGLPTPAALSTSLLAAGRCPNAFVFDRALRRSCVAGSSFALRLGLRVADRLRLRVDRLGLRVADRRGQHLEQVSLGRCGRFCHFATISLSTSRLPWPIARPSIARSFFGRPPALSRIPLLPSVCWRAEKSFPPLLAQGPSLFYRSWITSNFSDQ